jgi:hypothetical protein
VYDPAHHEPLGHARFTEAGARAAIAAICKDAEAAFDPETLWPLHASDYEPGTPEVLHSLYLGAAGMLHALQKLADLGFHEPALDHAAIAARLISAGPDEEGGDGSLLIGSTGMLLVARRFGHDTADALAEAIASNAEHPSNELLLGAPGTMLAARAMGFDDLWAESARVLLARQDDDGLWTQDLYGSKHRHLGAGHGFAGNVHALRGEIDPERAIGTARAFAVVRDGLANWPPVPGAELTRVQWCHGAPGMIVALAPLPGDHDDLLEAAGELTWRAGPLTRNNGLCHGTAGNGFAFLGLFHRTNDGRWLERAQAFTAHALEHVHGRYSLFTGDIGAALLAAACLTGDAAFPGLDDLGAGP